MHHYCVPSVICPVDDSLRCTSRFARKRILRKIENILLQINDGHDFGSELAREWTCYLELLLRGAKGQLSDPYADIGKYHVKLFSQATADSCAHQSLFILDELPRETTPPSAGADNPLQRSLFVIAIGGADTTFYKRLDRAQMQSFAAELYAEPVVSAFVEHLAADLIPRGFAAKKDVSGASVTNVESMILQAYAAGIRHVAIIANAKTYRPIKEYLTSRLGTIEDLTILVVAQPLLPQMRYDRHRRVLIISAEQGGTPGGHGHGFKYCFMNREVQELVKKRQLHYFIFANGDNSVVFNWGGRHYAQVIAEMQRLKKDPANAKLRIAFFLVWEYLRKGGFCFLLEDKETGDLLPQIFEAELARKSGADIDQLLSVKGGYNTNVAVGILSDVYGHLRDLPMALKEKKQDDYIDFTFEASLATAMTTYQDSNVVSHFDVNSSMYVLGPQSAAYQHWNHIALRKRDDLFAFHSSLFKVQRMKTAFGDRPVILTDRDATKKYPSLTGNWTSPQVLNSKEFFEIFAESYFDVDRFYGTICIELQQAAGKPRGKIKFRGTITLRGDERATLSFTVPAGQFWIIQDQQYVVDNITAPASSSFSM